MMHQLYLILLEWFRNVELIASFAKPLAALSVIVVLISAARLIHYVVKTILLQVTHRIAKRTTSQWDDILIQKKFFSGVSHLFPAFFLYASCFFATPALDKPLSDLAAETAAQLSADYYFTLGPLLLKFAKIYFIFTFVYIISTFLNAANEIYQTTPYAQSRSIKGYIQVTKIIIYFFAAILTVSILIGKDPTVLIAGLGAMAAVLLLVFKDTILGFVASIQLSANDMLKVGDWIEMPAHGANGNVTDITLNTVKVKNFDNTIVTIPTYSMVAESFTNWKGMIESEGRRIKRAFFVDLNTIRFSTPELFRKLENSPVVGQIIRKTWPEGTREGEMTNLTIFRRYLEVYLSENEEIHKGYDLVIRQLQSGSTGLPIEITIFSREKNWADYERLQSGIFEHIFAVISEFDLRIFQSPSGRDVRFQGASAL